MYSALTRPRHDLIASAQLQRPVLVARPRKDQNLGSETERSLSNVLHK